MTTRLASVIIPTYNRSEKIVLVLEALNKQSLPPDTYEVLVVDNNSQDNTKETIQRCIQRYPGLHLRYLFEKRQGLNFARNLGVQQALADVLVFLDDDAIPETDWLQALLDAYRDTKTGCVGGKITPDFPQNIRLPRWLSPVFNGYFSGFDPGGSQDRELTGNAYFPYGANISFKKEAIVAAGFFNPKLDRCGGNLIAGGETEMCLKIHRMGWKIFYSPRAVVHHLISPNRLTRRYFLDHAKGEGITMVLIDRSLCNNAVTYQQASNYLHGIVKYGRMLLSTIHEEDKRFYYYLRVRVYTAALHYWFKLLIFGTR